MRSGTFALLLALALPSPALSGMVPDQGLPPAATSAVTLAGGRQLGYDIYGKGPVTLVLVHGWMCDRSHWNFQIPVLAADYRVVTLDLPGHGQAAAVPADGGMEGLGAAVAQVAADAAKGDPIVLIGHSMGGPVVLDAARRLGGQAKGVVGVDTLKRPGTPRDPARMAGLEAMMRADFRGGTLKMVANSYFTPGADPALVKAVAEGMAAGPPDLAIRLATALDAYDAAAAMKALTAVPLVLINAAGRGTDRAAITAVRSDARVLELPGTGHFLMMETPAAFNAALRAELARLTDGKGTP